MESKAVDWSHLSVLRPPEETELTFSAYGYQGTEVMGLNLQTGKVVDYSNAPNQYDEPEGILPDGKHTLVECDRHCGKGPGHIDLYKLALDGSGRTERLTFFNEYPGYKASNRPAALNRPVAGDGSPVSHGVSRTGRRGNQATYMAEALWALLREAPRMPCN